MKNTAWKDGDDEIYTVEKDYSVPFFILFALIIIGFIAGQIILHYVSK